MKKKERDSSVEILRLYACIMVIFAHIQIGYTTGESIIGSAFVIKVLMGDNVPIFLAILGFFLFIKVQNMQDKKEIALCWRDKWKGFLLRIYIPTLVVTVIACFGSEYIYGKCSFLQLFTRPTVHWEYLTHYVLQLKPDDMVGHFWYIVVYIKILVLFPLLVFLCGQGDNYSKILRRGYMAACFICFGLQDLAFLKVIPAAGEKLPYFDYHILFILCGYEAWLFCKKQEKNRMNQIVAGFIIFGTGFLLRYGLTMYSFKLYGLASNDHFLVLECVPSYFTSTGLLILFYGLFAGMRNRVWNYIGNMTFYVYMVHGIMLRIFGAKGQSILIHNAYGVTSSHGLLYYLEYGFVIFASSFLFGLLVKYLLRFIGNMMYSRKDRVK